jgi:hypothetical protein
MGTYILVTSGTINYPTTFTFGLVLAGEAEAIAWSENGNHATISTTGSTAQGADAKLLGALGELNLLSNTNIKGAR